MARVNIYLPDDTAEMALRAARQRAWLAALQDREPIELDPDVVLAAVREARSAR